MLKVPCTSILWYVALGVFTKLDSKLVSSVLQIHGYMHDVFA